MDEIYREVILDHYKNPAYKGKIENSDYSFEDEIRYAGMSCISISKRMRRVSSRMPSSMVMGVRFQWRPPICCWKR
jgi:hypothetical protein